MRERSLSKLVLLSIASAVVVVTGMRSVAAPNRGNQQGAAQEVQQVSVTLTPLPENPRQYSLVLSDADEHVISGSFSTDQLQILKAIMVEAEKFALTAEAVGAKEPITTRLSDKRERAFLVDIQKGSNQSMLFLTLKTDSGRMTWAAGRIIRNTRRQEGFFFDLLSRLESALPKISSQPSK